MIGRTVQRIGGDSKVLGVICWVFSSKEGYAPNILVEAPDGEILVVTLRRGDGLQGQSAEGLRLLPADLAARSSRDEVLEQALLTIAALEAQLTAARR